MDYCSLNVIECKKNHGFSVLCTRKKRYSVLCGYVGILIPIVMLLRLRYAAHPTPFGKEKNILYSNIF